jgi:hypothetical protein
VLVLNKPAVPAIKSHVYQSIPSAAVTRIPAGAICEKSPARIAASRPSSTGMAGAVPYLNARPQDAQLLPAAAQAQPHGRVSPIVRSAQQAPPADPSEQGVVQPAA